MRRQLIALGAWTLVAWTLVAWPLAANAQDPSGTWLSETGETRVRIARCGGGYCGTIAWVKDSGAKDANNPTASLRGRSLVGVQMISNLRPAGGDGWSGSLYNYKDGKTYTGKLRLRGANALELSGCVLGGIICRSQTWTRVN